MSGTIYQPCSLRERNLLVRCSLLLLRVRLLQGLCCFLRDMTLIGVFRKRFLHIKEFITLEKVPVSLENTGFFGGSPETKHILTMISCN